MPTPASDSSTGAPPLHLAWAKTDSNDINDVQWMEVTIFNTTVHIGTFLVGIILAALHLQHRSSVLRRNSW
jgi:hypothetical protein